MKERDRICLFITIVILIVILLALSTLSGCSTVPPKGHCLEVSNIFEAGCKYYGIGCKRQRGWCTVGERRVRHKANTWKCMTHGKWCNTNHAKKFIVFNEEVIVPTAEELITIEKDCPIDGNLTGSPDWEGLNKEFGINTTIPNIPKIGFTEEETRELYEITLQPIMLSNMLTICDVITVPETVKLYEEGE